MSRLYDLQSNPAVTRINQTDFLCSGTRYVNNPVLCIGAAIIDHDYD